MEEQSASVESESLEDRERRDRVREARTRVDKRSEGRAEVETVGIVQEPERGLRPQSQGPGTEGEKGVRATAEGRGR